MVANNQKQLAELATPSCPTWSVLDSVEGFFWSCMNISGFCLSILLHVYIWYAFVISNLFSLFFIILPLFNVCLAFHSYICLIKPGKLHELLPKRQFRLPHYLDFLFHSPIISDFNLQELNFMQNNMGGSTFVWFLTRFSVMIFLVDSFNFTQSMCLEQKGASSF